MKDVNEGVKTAAMFSLGCGNLSENEAKNKIILDFLQQKESSPKREKQAREVMENLSTLFPYLSLIGKYAKLDPFHKDVVEAYFMGNDLIEKVPHRELLRMVSELIKTKSPLVLSKKFKATHNFYVFCISPYVKQRKEGILVFMDLCSVSLGVVREISPNEMVPIAVVERKTVKGEIVTEKMIYDRTTAREVTVGSQVATHWRRVVKKINKDEAKNLEYHSKQALTCL
jgi:hydrogenase maturation factor